ncbi:FCD domain-containing protein [Patulibacter sp. SYSU D01012]|uniref:FadR/GntR family transcriptional regulator n=1 Tax=Patulibacter sp. SYSU D01012 TaxID=2817381 RepID=UPI001B300432|nr:FCD domain-containing protein [Patulibacter sp. SYSU D01012]
MPLRPTARPRLSDQVIDQLRGLVAAGEWPVGTRIPTEPALVAQLGVGRNTVREAVRALVHAGLLDVRQGDGTYVRATSELDAALARRLERSSALETLEVRAPLEREAARLAALRRDDRDRAAIAAALRERHALRPTGDLEAFVAADLRFHRAVVAAAHNGLLAELYEHLMTAFEALLHRTEAGVPEDPGVGEGHTALAAAIDAGDPVAAEAAAAALLAAARAHTVQVLRAGEASA